MQSITPVQVSELLKNVRGTTFARIETVTQVATAAAHKDIVIQKHTVANVQLYNNLKDFTDVYTNAVKRSAAKLGASSTRDIEEFQSQSNYFEHMDCYSLVKHKEQDKYYLFAIYNNGKSEYLINGKSATKEQVAVFLTPSAKKKLLQEGDAVFNVSNNVTHDVIVRVISLSNIVSITVMGTELIA